MVRNNGHLKLVLFNTARVKNRPALCPREFVALFPRPNAAVHPDAMPGPAGDCPLETATGIVTDVELPTFDMQLKLPELNVSFNSDD